MLFLLSSPLVQPKSQKIITLDAFLNQSKQCCVLTLKKKKLHETEKGDNIKYKQYIYKQY